MLSGCWVEARAAWIWSWFSRLLSVKLQLFLSNPEGPSTLGSVPAWTILLPVPSLCSQASAGLREGFWLSYLLIIWGGHPYLTWSSPPSDKVIRYQGTVSQTSHEGTSETELITVPLISSLAFHHRSHQKCHRTYSADYVHGARLSRAQKPLNSIQQWLPQEPEMSPKLINPTKHRQGKFLADLRFSLS